MMYDILVRARNTKESALSPIFLAKEKFLYPNYNKT